MAALISKVDDVFEITGRGCVVVPGVPAASQVRVRVGDALLLKLPDGRERRTRVRGFEMGGRRPFTPLLLGAELVKSDVPPGTELWTVDA